MTDMYYGNRLIVEPIRKGQLLALLATMETLDVTFPDADEDLPRTDFDSTINLMFNNVFSLKFKL